MTSANSYCTGKQLRKQSIAGILQHSYLADVFQYAHHHRGHQFLKLCYDLSVGMGYVYPGECFSRDRVEHRPMGHLLHGRNSEASRKIGLVSCPSTFPSKCVT